jgi:hypothetical protein
MGAEIDSIYSGRRRFSCKGVECCARSMRPPSLSCFGLRIGAISRSQSLPKIVLKFEETIFGRWLVCELDSEFRPIFWTNLRRPSLHSKSPTRPDRLTGNGHPASLRPRDPRCQRRLQALLKTSQVRGPIPDLDDMGKLLFDLRLFPYNEILWTPAHLGRLMWLHRVIWYLSESCAITDGVSPHETAAFCDSDSCPHLSCRSRS